jgi:hypothetical protein
MATQPDGSPALVLWLRHADKGIFWQQIDPPQEKDEDNEKHGRGRPKAHWNAKEFCETIRGEGNLKRDEIKKRACSYGAFKQSHFESRVWRQLRDDHLTQDGDLWRVK